MIPKEAIEILENGLWWDELNPEASDAAVNPLDEALNMAIASLRAQQEREDLKPTAGGMKRRIMREILFRGKRKDNGEWVEGWFVNLWLVYYQKYQPLITDELGVSHEVDPATVVQYTGMTDITGKKIFEADCVRDLDDSVTGVIRYGAYKNPINGNPLYYNTGFYVDWVSGECKDYLIKDLGNWANRVKIVGNVYDSLKLLEGTK